MSTRTISTRLSLDGEAEYKAKLKNINAELSLHKSELEKVQVQYKGSANTLEALSAKQTALKGQLDALNQKHAEQEKMLQKAQDAQKKFSSEADELQSKLEALKASSEDTAEEEKKLAEQLAEAEKGLQLAENAAMGYQKQLNLTERDQLKLGEELKRTEQYLNEAESDFYKCADSIDEYGNEVKEAGKESEDFGNKSADAFNALASALAAAGVAGTVKEIADALMDCVNVFASFEAQMSTVQAISGATGEQMAALSEKAKYMGATTAFTATEAGQALEYMAMAGWKTEDMLNGLEGIMHLAAASGESLASTSDIVTDALTAFGLSAADSGHFADVLATASSNANTNVGMMGETFKYAAPVAGALGYSIEDTALAIGLMANAGIKSTQAGTALRGTLTNLAKPSKENAAYMKDLGISLTDASGNARSLSEVIELLRDRFSDLTETEKAEYAAGIAGKEAMSGLLAIVNASEVDYQKLNAAIQSCNEAAYEMSQTKLDNYAGQLTLLNSAADGLKLAIGEALTPALRKLAEVGTDAFSWASGFVSENQWLVQAIAGAVGAVLLLAGGLTTYTAVATAAKLIQDALNRSISLCPLVAATAAVGALVVAIGSWVASLDDTDEKTKKFSDTLQESKSAYEDTAAAMEEHQASTRATADALQQLLAVEEKSALQKALIQQKVDALNEAVPELGLYYDQEKDSLVGLTEAELESALARAQAQEEYEAQLARLDELDNERVEIEARLTEARLALNEAEETGAGNVRELQNNIAELTAAQEENAAQIEELTEASKAYAEQQAEMKLNTQVMTDTVDELISEMTDLQNSYTETYEAAMESINSQMGLFQEMDGTAKTSIGSMIDALKSQVEYMETYAANIQKAMEMGVDEGLVKKLSDGSEESAQILAAIVAGGEEDIQALNEEFAKVEEGKNDFAHTLTDMQLDFDKAMSELEDRLGETIRELDASSDARTSGENTIQGYIQGAESMRGALESKYKSLANAANRAFSSALDMHSPSRVFKTHGKNTILGDIEGAEGERQHLEKTYVSLAESASKSYAEASQLDIHSLISGIKEIEPKLAAAYEQAAQAALTSMERHLPSTIEVPSNAAAISRQTDAILSAISSWDGGGALNIYVDKLEVRDDSDAHRIAQELYSMTRRESRSRGGGTL